MSIRFFTYRSSLRLLFPIIAFAFSSAAGISVAAWLDAPNAPPNYGISAPNTQEYFMPMNLSASPQTKLGEISASAFIDNLDANYKIDPASTGYAGIFKGLVGIGQRYPAASLAVNNGAEVTGKTGSPGDAIYAYAAGPSTTAISAEQADPAGYAIYASGGINFFGGDVHVGSAVSPKNLCLNGDCKTAWPSDGEPQGTIIFYEGATCPTGYTEVTDARGRYLVGFQPGGTVGGTRGTPLSNLEDRPAGQHTHNVTTLGAFSGSGGGNGNSSEAGTTRTTDTGAGLIAGTNAPYIQYIVCKKTVSGGSSAASEGWDFSGNNVFLSDSANNVGIGKAAPTEKLDVVGNIKASGTICGSAGCVGGGGVGYEVKTAYCGGYDCSVSCSPGKVVLGGGCNRNGATWQYMLQTAPLFNSTGGGKYDGWFCTSNGPPFTAYAICANF